MREVDSDGPTGNTLFLDNAYDGIRAGGYVVVQTPATNAVATAIEVRKVLQSAIANAENNHQLDVDRLFVKEATVGKGLVMKRFSPRARGRAGTIRKPFSHLTIIVREREETA